MRKKLLFTISVAMMGLGIYENAEAQSGASLDFDGSNDYVDIGASMNTVLDPLTSITVEAWVYPTSSSGYGVIAGNYNTTANNGQLQFLLRRDGTQYSFFIDNGSGYTNAFTGVSTVVLNTWQHVAGTWDGTNIQIYIDGNLMGITPKAGGNLITTSNSIFIGHNILNENFTGSIDEVRIWSTARSMTEIQSTMNCPVREDETGLLALYSFNDGVSGGTNSGNTTLHNVKGNGYNGTLINFNLSGATSNYTTDYFSDYMSLQSSVGSTAMSDRLYAGLAIDYDNDGDKDIMVYEESSATRLYLNDGLGNFSSYTIIHTAGSGGPLVVGDLDNDNDDDYLLSGATTLIAYINDGAGNFTPLGTNLINGTGRAGAAAIMDINNDNKVDIIFGNANSSGTDQTEVWLNTGTTGNPSFVFSWGTVNGLGKNAVAVGDVDEDGDKDFLVGSSSNGGTLYLNNSNNGTFTMGVNPPGYSGGAQLIDWNMDGHLDFVNYEYYNRSFMVRFGDGSGTFPNPTTLINLSTINAMQFADMNGDGFLDAIAAIWGGNGLIYLNNGCSFTMQTGCNYNLGHADNFVTVADYNNDGTPDVFCQARDNKSTFYMNYLDPVTTAPLSNIASVTGIDICSGNTATISATADNPGTFNWYNVPTGGSSLGTGSPYTTGALTTGTYTYYVSSTNPNNCVSARESVVVTVTSNPAASLSSSAVTTLNCNGDTNGDAQIDVVFDASVTNATYLWDDSNSTTTEDLSGIGAGTYTVTITDDNNCVNTFSVNITEPTAVAGSITSVNVTCNAGTDGSVDLTATGGTGSYTFLWDDSSSSTTEDLSGLGAGTYTVIITDVNSCTGTTNITITEPTAVTGSVASVDVSCNGDTDGSIDLTATGGTGTLAFLWDDSSSSTTEDISGLPAGTYNVTITDDNGCTETTSATITEPTALGTSNTSTDEINGNDGSIDLTVTGGTSPYTYSWTGPNSFAATTEDLSGLVAGTYDVTITDANGCTTTAQVIVGTQVGINEINGVAFDIYPNPSTGIFNVRFNANSTFTISVHNAIGQLIYSNTTSDKINTVDLSAFERGAYFLTIESGNQKKTVPVVLTK